MTPATEPWSKPRQVTAQRVSAVLYGVVGIMTAELSVQPGEFGYVEAALGALLVGLAMYVTHIFVMVVKVECDLGAHLPLGKARGIALDSLLVMLFPGVTALLIVAAAVTTARWTALLDLILYLGMAAVFATGFLSSYVLDRAALPALRRGFVWLVLSVILVIAKSLA